MRLAVPLAILVLNCAAAPAQQAWWVEFAGPPAAVTHEEALKRGDKAAAAAAARAQIAANRAAQAVLDGLKSTGAVQPLFAVQRVLNAVAVVVDSGGEASLRALPGVVNVEPLRPVKLMNSTSVPWLGAPAAWTSLPEGLTGDGVRIGIIDTGIDYLHPDFGGAGTAALYEQNDRLIIGDVPYPTLKVAGGYDFVGDAYEPFSDAGRLPVPDPDPMDQNGHGTHVAGTAAGLGVLNSGAAFTGGYDNDVPFDSLLIGPGVAPRAVLYALKVFGRSGDSEIVVPAIEWAADPDGDGDFSDRLDVINLSLGEEFGRADGPLSRAAENAARVGVVVVASAGNTGDTYCVVGAPAAAPSAICVAAAEHGGAGLVPGRLAGFSSRGPGIAANGAVLVKPDLTAPGVGIISAAVGSPRMLTLRSTRSGTSMASPHVAGAAALVRQRHPDWPPSRVKALLMNTANAGVYIFQADGARAVPVPPQRAGAGMLDLGNLARAQVVATPSIQFLLGDADLPAGAPVDEVARIYLENFGDTAVDYTVSLVELAASLDLTVRVSPDRITVPPRGRAEAELRLTGDGMPPTQPRERLAVSNYRGAFRHFLSELAGHVEFLAVDPDASLRVPYYACYRPVTRLTPVSEALRAESMPSEIVLEGVPLSDARNYGVNSLVTPFLWLGASGREPGVPQHEAFADLKYFGVARARGLDGPAPGVDALTFGIATHAPWATPHSLQVYVFIDANFDGGIDFSVRSGFTRAGSGGAPRFADVFMAELLNADGDLLDLQPINGYLPDGAPAPYIANTALHRTDIMALPLDLAKLDLPAAQDRLRFLVETVIDPHTSLTGLRFVDALPAQDFATDITRWYEISLRDPGLAFPREEIAAWHIETRPANAPLPLHFDAAGYARVGAYTTARDQVLGPLGVLLLQHHNTAAARAQTVPLLTGGDTDQDGLADTADGANDADGDFLPNFADVDSDSDTVPDAYEGTRDADGDGLPNYLDLDSDSDTIPDEDEYRTGASDPYRADTDGDGLRDDVEGATDPDGDGTPNTRDLDSDNDGLPDAVEGVQDPDNDGVPAFLDLDSDNDGITDAEEGADDPDRDGTGSFADLDSDNDTLLDADERQRGTDPYARDTDGDGVADAADRDALVPSAPAAPGEFSAVPADCGVALTWAAVPGATEYRVYRAPVLGLHMAAFEPLSGWITGLHFRDITAEPFQPVFRRGCLVEPARNYPYAYRVVARNAWGEGPPSLNRIAERPCAED